MDCVFIIYVFVCNSIDYIANTGSVISSVQTPAFFTVCNCTRSILLPVQVYIDYEFIISRYVCR